jgi:hypothetical protein
MASRVPVYIPYWMAEEMETRATPWKAVSAKPTRTKGK